MQIGLFEIQNDVVIPDQVAVRIFPWLRKIKEEFPDQYMQVYAYLFYMNCWDGRNIYVNIPLAEREAKILEDIYLDICLDSKIITTAMDKCKELYRTPIVDMMEAAQIQMKLIAKFLRETTPTGGKNGNAEAINKFMEKLSVYHKMYNEFETKLKEEQAKIRGGRSIAYDQEDQLL